MLEEHAKILDQRDLPSDVQDLFAKCKDLIEMSRSRMSTYYDQWDFSDNLAKNRKLDDQQDSRAQERKEPRKMVVPLTSSQVDTFVSFAYMVLTQREQIFELEGAGQEDIHGAKIASALLERDLKKSNFRGSVLLDALNNCAKFNLGVFKHSWIRESEWVEEEQPTQGINPYEPGMEIMTGVETISKELVSFLGNRVVSVSPYKFFPDPRFPITRLQEGEFCGDECEHSTSRLKVLQKQGLLAGLEHVQPMTSEVQPNRRIGFRDNGGDTEKNLSEYLEDNYILTEIQLELVPSETMFGGKALGPEDYPVKFVIWYLNDQRIVRISELAYGHNNYLYRPIQYTSDETEYIGPALPDLIDKMQEAISWFINSRITSVRKVIDNKLIVDPRGIDIKALKRRDPILLLKPNAQGSDVRRWVQQLNVTDVTANHLNDVAALTGLARETTGLSENLLGQFSPGRRSAAEARTVNANAAARVKKIVDAIWYTGLEPLGSDMIANHRSYLDAEQIIKVIGSETMASQPNLIQGAIQFLNVTMEDIQGNYDFVIYDGTLPSEKGQNAEGLQSLLEILLGAPQLLPALGYDFNSIHEIIMEILTLRGVKNARRFRAPTGALGLPGPGQPQGATAPVQEPQGAQGLPVPPTGA